MVISLGLLDFFHIIIFLSFISAFSYKSLYLCRPGLSKSPSSHVDDARNEGLFKLDRRQF